MIRVAIFAEQKVPDTLMTLLEESSDVEVNIDLSSADVLLMYSGTWNRESFGKIRALLRSKNPEMQKSPPIVVVCQRIEEPFATDSLRQDNVSGVLPMD